MASRSRSSSVGGSPKNRSGSLSARGLRSPGFGSITTIKEDQVFSDSPTSNKKKTAKSTPELGKFSASYSACKDTYGIMSAKARKAKIHPEPVRLRAALPGRDCLAWVREDKQYSPYSYFECSANKPTRKPKKSKGPPPLWLPVKAKEPKYKESFSDDIDDFGLGAEAGEDGFEVTGDAAQRPAGWSLVNRAPWDSSHHIMASRANPEVQSGVREYFDKPKRLESDGVPQVRETYCMNDRQCNWNDEPAPFGEMRRTLYDNIGPVNIGGCKEQQLPSYWRKVQDWSLFKEPEWTLSMSNSGKPIPNKPLQHDKTLLLKSLADLPADQATEFWRGWAERRAGPKALPKKNRWDAPQGWDNRWQITPSRTNEGINYRQREYFSLHEGQTGVATEKPRLRKSAATLSRVALQTNRFLEL